MSLNYMILLGRRHLFGVVTLQRIIAGISNDVT